MKCENCGKNEVSFVYESNVNGRMTRRCLCGECAQKLGFAQAAAEQSQRMMRGMRGLFGGMLNGSLLDSFFSPEQALPGGGDLLFGENPFDDFFDGMPALGAAQPETEQQDGQPSAQQPARRDALVDEGEQSRFARMRRRNELRMEMKKAVRQEDFERAAQLRDQLRAMEKEEKNDERGA